VTLSSAPTSPLAFVYLSQIPYTGLDLGPVGTFLYWLALILWSLALAYLLIFKMIPYVRERTSNFGQNVRHAINTEMVLPVETPVAQVFHSVVTPTRRAAEEMVHAHYSEKVEPIAFPNTDPIDEVPAPSAARGYSTYDGFKSFGKSEALTIDDIVKGLAREPMSARPSVPERAPQMREAPAATQVPRVEMKEMPTDVRGFVGALMHGDKDAAFGTIRTVIRGGGSVETFLTSALVALDDAYRARVDGTALDPEIARMTASIETPRLERMVGALATAVDSSYSIDATAAKVAVTRALGVIAS
jgi:hypothetical protein